MAVAFQDVFYSINDVQYRITIDDEDLVSATSYTFKTDSDLFTLTYEGQAEERFNPVIPSKCSIGMVIQGTNEEDFLEGLVDSEDGRFKLKIEKYNKGSLSYELFWVGSILTDQVSYEDTSPNFIFRMNALDELGILSDIPYNNNGTPYSGTATIIEHLINIFDKTNLGYFYASSDEFLRVVCDWYEDNHVYNALSPNDPLINSRFNHIAMYREDDEGNISFFDCGFVLQQLATIFGARVYQADGAIRFEQINEKNENSYYQWTYNKLGVEVAAAAVDQPSFTINGTITKSQLAGGVYTFLPGLKNIKLNYVHESNRNLLLGNTWTNASNNSLIVGEIEPDGATSTFSFVANLYVKINVTGTMDGSYRWEFKLRLKHDTDYFNRSITDNGFGTLTAGTAEWGTSSLDYVITTDWIAGEQVLNIPIQFETPVIPNTTGQLEFDFNYHAIYKQAGTITGTPPIEVENWELQSPFLEFFTDGTPDLTNTRIFQINNSNFPNHTQNQEITTYFGDAITNVTRGKLQVYDGSDWIDSNSWGRPGDDGLSIMELMIFERIAGQKQGLPQYNGQFISVGMDFSTRFTYGGVKFLHLESSFAAKDDIWSGSFFKININRTNLAFGSQVNQGGSNTTGLTGGSSSGSSSGGSNTTTFTPPTPQFFNNFSGTALTGITATLPGASNADRYVKLYRDGRLLRHGASYDYTIDEINNEIDLNLQAIGENFQLEVFEQ